MILPKNFLKDYKKNGFCLLKKFYNKTEVKKTITIFNKKLNKLKKKSNWTEREPDDALSTYPIKDKDYYLLKLASSQKLNLYGKSVLNKDIFVSHSKCNIKPAWSGTSEYFHQDAIYTKARCKNPSEMVMAIIICEQHNEDNGCLQLFSGSHKLGLIKHQKFINVNGISKFTIKAETLTKIEKKFKMTKLNASSGDVLFFHPYLIHGSNHNYSSKRRMIILTQYNAIGNELISVQKNLVKYNIKRSQYEFDEANRRLKWFKKKFYTQKNSKKVLFIKPNFHKII